MSDSNRLTDLVELLRSDMAGADTCDEAADAIEELMALLKECADDLEEELDNRYGNVHPAMQKRYDMDMAPVRAARAALEKKND